MDPDGSQRRQIFRKCGLVVHASFVVDHREAARLFVPFRFQPPRSGNCFFGGNTFARMLAPDIRSLAV